MRSSHYMTPANHNLQNFPESSSPPVEVNLCDVNSVSLLIPLLQEHWLGTLEESQRLSFVESMPDSFTIFLDSLPAFDCKVMLSGGRFSLSLVLDQCIDKNDRASLLQMKARFEEAAERLLDDLREAKARADVTLESMMRTLHGASLPLEERIRALIQSSGYLDYARKPPEMHGGSFILSNAQLSCPVLNRTIFARDESDFTLEVVEGNIIPFFHSNFLVRFTDKTRKEGSSHLTHTFVCFDPRGDGNNTEKSIEIPHWVDPQLLQKDILRDLYSSIQERITRPSQLHLDNFYQSLLQGKGEGIRWEICEDAWINVKNEYSPRGDKLPGLILLGRDRYDYRVQIEILGNPTIGKYDERVIHSIRLNEASTGKFGDFQYRRLSSTEKTQLMAGLIEIFPSLRSVRPSLNPRWNSVIRFFNKKFSWLP